MLITFNKTGVDKKKRKKDEKMWSLMNIHKFVYGLGTAVAEWCLEKHLHQR